ncbi:tumor necrosis factor ligand superfamily member 14 [Myripristis murdjan]|uniref:tumor necrosis factor ligand superfamily member 14 n=1 Tax=Myripristis murdjan TaxID=586833 RepID=UPI0011762F1F|nr:tumor necrosis factor ligand superfamily member 6-like [Myripristis murdjan]
MAEHGVKYPSVFVVDSHTAYPPPPVPPRPSRQPRRTTVCQTLLFLLVSLALCGMVIEACFIYRLYQTETADSASTSKVFSDDDDLSGTERPSLVVLPSKPVAHLTDGQNVHHRNKVMSWSTDAQPLLHEMEYKDGRLVIQKEGYYYVYSKVFFKDSEMFYHLVKYETPRYPGGNITLLESRKYSPRAGKTVVRSNSYLGGVFHFNAGDGIFVEVSNVAHIVRLQANENFFGAYMI